jgi:tRNA A37 methylthiotransferase MiaB
VDHPLTAGGAAGAPKVAFKTLGCRLNQAESEKALEGLGARGFDLAHAGE